VATQDVASNVSTKDVMRFELFIASRYLRANRRQVEAFCRRERSGSRRPKSRAKRGTSR